MGDGRHLTDETAITGDDMEEVYRHRAECCMDALGQIHGNEYLHGVPMPLALLTILYFLFR